MNNLKWYYSKYLLQYHFLKYLKNREFAVLPSKEANSDRKASKRNMRVHNIQSFQFWMARMDFFEKNRNVNLYYSCASYKDGVPFSDPANLSIMSDEWKLDNYKYIDSYDFLLDIDSDFSDFDFALETAKIIKLHFDLNDVPYMMRFSGRGFHFIIPYDYFRFLNLHFNPFEDGNIYSLFQKISKRLHDDISEMIDYSIYDSRRIMKLPYSYALYDEGAFLCCPLDTLEGFTIANYKNIQIKELKNDCIFNSGGTVKWLLKG